MPSIVAPLRRPTFRRMVTSQFMAETGDGVTLVALPLYVYDRTGSALITSLTFTAELVGSVVLGVVGGLFADAFDRRRVLMISSVLRGLLLVAAFLVEPVWLTVAFGVLSRSMGAMDNPSFDSLVPSQAVGDLQQVLAVRRLIQAVSITIGPAVGAFSVELIGARSSLLLNVVAYATACALMWTLPGLDRGLAERRESQRGRSYGAQLGDLLRGMTVVVTTPVVTRMVLYWALNAALVAVSMGASIIWFEDDLSVSGSWFGISVAAYGVGAAVGTGLAGGRSFDLPLPVILSISIPIYALCSALCVAAEVPWLLPLGWLIWGIALGPELVLGELVIVSGVPEERLGRAFAGIGIANTLGMAVGYAAIGPLLEAYGARPVILGGAVLQFVMIAMWIGPALHWRSSGGMARGAAG